MRVRIVTLGCKVNQYESEAIASMLKNAGIERAEEHEEADILILNSCTVTAASDQKVRQTLRREKKNNPGAVMVLTGCMAQAFPEKSQELEEADIVLGTSNRARLLPHVLSFLANRQRIIDIEPHKNGETFESMEIEAFGDRTRAYLKIQDGCNRFCSYCIIPYARGRVRSKPMADLQQEVRRLAAHGYKEIVLTGINLSTYGQEWGLGLCDALEVTAAEEGIERVRLGSLEPELLERDVIKRMAGIKKLCPQFHLSLQSGCDETLRRMNRHYTADEYREIVGNLREAFDNPAITTDIMVGFAGETDIEFEKSLAFAEEIKFSQTHVFAYSKRPGTRAYEMPGQIQNKVKEERSHRMAAVAKETKAMYLAAQVGKTEEVLFEQKMEAGLYLGHTRNYVEVAVASGKNIHGEALSVLITHTDELICYGKLQE